MAKERKISGIFVPIQLDTSLVEQDLSKLKNSFGAVITAMQKGMANALSSYKLGSGFIELNRALGQIRDGAEALSRTRMSEFTKSVQSAESELKKLADTFGGTEKQQEWMIKRLAETQGINRQISGLKLMQKWLNLTSEDAVRLSRNMGQVVSDQAMFKFTGQKDLASQLGKISEEYRKLANLAGAPMSNEGFQKFLDTNRIKTAIDAYQKLNNGQKLTKEGFEQIAKAAGVSQQQVAAYVAEMERAGQVRRGWAGVFTPSNMAAGIQSGLSAFGVVGGMYGAAELTKAAYQSALKMENIELAFQSIFTNTAAAGAQIDYVRDLTDKLGLSFLDASEGAKKLFAAARGTEVEKDAQDIFEAFSTMGAALKLSGTEMESVFLAVSQMISKGKVSAEELRLQLAERMPGAVNLFAKAIGVTTAELDKMLQEGKVGLDSLRAFANEVQKTYETGAEKASRGLQAELNRTANAWFNVKKAFVDTQASADALRSVSFALEGIGKHADIIKEATVQLVKLAAAIGAVAVAAKILLNFKAIIAAVTAALRAFASALLGPIGLITGFTFLILDSVTASDKGSEAMDRMGGSVEGYTKRLKSAVEAQKEFNTSSLEYARNAVSASKSSAMSVFATDETNRYSITGDEYTSRSGLSKQLESLKTFFGSKSNAVLSKAQAFSQKLGKDFFAGFNVSENLLKLDPGMAEEQLNSLEEYLSTAANRLDVFWNELRESGASNDVLKAYKDIVDGSLKSIEDVIKKQRELIALQKEANESGVDFNAKDYAKSIDRLKEATKSVKLFEDEESKKKIASFSKELNTILTNIDSLKVALESGKLSGKEYADQIAQGEDQLRKFAALALESGVNVNDFASIILSKFPEATRHAGMLRDVFAQIANLNLSKGLEDFTKNLKIDLAFYGESARMKSLASAMSKLKIDQSAEEVKKALKSGSFEGLTIAGVKIDEKNLKTLKDAYQISVELDKLDANKKAASSASKAAKAYESVEKSIESLNRQVDTWQAKTKESNTEKVSIQLEKYNKEIERLLRTGKASSDQIRRLEEVKVKLKEAAAAYEDYILKREKEKALDFYKSAADDYSKITGLVDPTIIQKSAQTVYEKQLDEARKFLEAKVLTQEEYNQLEVMLDTKKNDEIRRNSQELYDNLTLAVEDYYAKYRNFATGMGEVMTMAMDGLSSAIADFATTGMTNFNQLGQAFADLANNILATINKLLAQQLVSSLFSFATDFFNPAPARQGASAVPTFPWGPQAKGGAFVGGSLSSYSNTVVSTPTVFSAATKIPAYAKGAGLMGEAGPEAIMPLIRTPSGHLGVRSEGGGNIQQNVVINIIDQVGVNVKQKESRDNQGNTRLDLIIEQHVAQSMARQGSPTNRVLSNTYGARPALASR